MLALVQCVLPPAAEVFVHVVHNRHHDMGEGQLDHWHIAQTSKSLEARLALSMFVPSHGIPKEAGMTQVPGMCDVRTNVESNNADDPGQVRLESRTHFSSIQSLKTLF